MNTFRIKDLRFRILKGGKIGLCASIMMFGMLNSTLNANNVVYNGGGTGGIFVGSSFFETTKGNLSDSISGETLTVGSTTDTTIFTNYFTEGGAGSGGGAGLGGVFFVNDGSGLTLNNVSFSSNAIKGGEGGSVGTANIGNMVLSLPSIKVNANPLTIMSITPTITVDGSGNVTITGATLSSVNSMIQNGSAITFDGGAGNGSISAVSGTSVTFGSGIEVAPTAIHEVLASASAGNSITVSSVISGSDVKQGMLVYGAGIPTGTTITEVTYSGSNIATIKLSNNTTAPITSLNVLGVSSFDASQYAISNGGTTVTPSSSMVGLQAGMTVTGDGIPNGTTITSVNNDGTVTLNNSISSAKGFTAAMTSAAVGSSTLTLGATRSDLAVGMTVSGNGIPDGTTITAINGTDITLSNAITSAAASAISNNSFSASFSKVIDDTGTVLTLSTVSGLSKGQLLTGSGVPANAVITAINPTTKEVTYTIDANAANLQKGGSMNGLAATGTVGATGNNGRNGSMYNAILHDGEGSPGTNGYNAGNGTANVGGDGGNGGNGSSGLPYNADAILGLTGAIVGATSDTAAVVADFGDLGFARAAVDITKAALAWVDVGIATADLTMWNIDLTAGIVGLGGDGGSGGDAGGGDDFFGGGAGGKGGDGGNGALSYTDGGAGGDGGQGGAGGFGAGGGAGGAGGAGGTTGAAADGNPGEAGFAGFGAGQGSYDGMYGGGGSGFGGAIFVRSNGTLVVQGNSTFENNYVFAGSSNNNGEAGEAAGSDIFIMKGSDALLAPGAGHVIRIEGTIADDSQATYSTASWAAGAGATLRFGSGGLVQLLGNNTYSGNTQIEGATLEADIGVGINNDSHILFAGTGSLTSDSADNSITAHVNAGVLLTSGQINRRVDVWSNAISWNGAGGFAASSQDGLILNFGAITSSVGQTLLWNSPSISTNSTMIFGSEYGQGAVSMLNNININGSTANIAVFDSALTETDYALLTGKLTNGNLQVGDTGYNGTLFLTGDSSLNNLTINSGKTSTKFVQGNITSTGHISTNIINTNIVLNNDAQLVLGGNETLGTVNLVGTASHLTTYGTTSMTSLNNAGNLMAEGALTATNIVNSKILTIAGGLNATSIVNNATGTFNALSNVTTTGNVTNNADGIWNQSADLTVNAVANNGIWNILGETSDRTKTITTTGTGLTGLTGTGTFNLATVGDVTGNLEINQSGDSLFKGVVQGAGSLIKTGSGNLQIGTAQTFTGDLEVREGTFETLLDPGELEDNVNVIVYNGATFIAGYNDTIGSVTNNGTYTMNENISTKSDFTNNRILSLNANLTTGDTDSLNGINNDFINNGTTTLTADRTVTTEGGLVGTTAGVINVSNSDATLTLDQSGTTTYSGTITGAGSFTKTGNGNLILNGTANSVNLGGTLTIANGKLGLDGAGILHSNLDVIVSTAGELDLISGNQQIWSLAGSGHIDLGSNILYVNNGGSFEGTVIGSGKLDIQSGSFYVSNDITSTEGTFNVNDGATTTINQNSNLTFPTVEVQAGGTLNIAGNVEASNNVLVNADGILHLTNGGNIDTNLASIYGILNGIGSITGTTTAYAGSYLRPGNSPGSITLDNLVLDNGSTTDMEINDSGTAGVDFDQITLTDKFTINNGTTLNIIKYDTAMPVAAELAQGEKVKIFNFTPGKISGYFTDVTSTYTNDTILNLQTGEVVGLGGTTIAQFENGVTSNANQMKILNDLKVNETNGVAQYYGGQIASRLASNQGNATETKKIFETFSPEVYSSLLEQNKFNLLSSTSKLPTDLENTKTGLSISMDRNTYKTDENSNYMSYKMEGNELKIDHTGKFYEGFIVTSINAIDGDITSEYTDGSTQNYGINIASVQPLGSEDLTFRAQASYIKGDTDLSRKTYDSTSYAKNIDSSGMMGGLGLGYDKKFSNFKLATTLDLLYYKSQVDGFTESNANSFDALNIHKQDENGVVSKLQVKATKDLTENLSVSGKVEYNKFFNSDNNKVTANVALEDTLISVENPGIGNDIVGLGLGFDYKVNKEWSAEFNSGISGDKDLTQNSNVGIQVKYAF